MPPSSVKPLCSVPGKGHGGCSGRDKPSGGLFRGTRHESQRDSILSFVEHSVASGPIGKWSSRAISRYMQLAPLHRAPAAAISRQRHARWDADSWNRPWRPYQAGMNGRKAACPASAMTRRSEGLETLSQEGGDLVTHRTTDVGTSNQSHVGEQWPSQLAQFIDGAGVAIVA